MNPQVQLSCKLLFIIIAIFFSIPAESIVAQDSIQTKMLDEVVVKSSKSWLESDKAVFIPTKRDKNLSYDPISLIECLRIPMIVKREGELVTVAGEKVAIFINGKRIDNIDTSSFWSKNVMRVEFMVNPSNPIYEGESAVINIAMKEYKAGGTTRIHASQTIPNDGYYTVGSRLDYRKMSFNAMASFDYSTSHGEHSIGEETFNGICYDHVFYDHLDRQFEADHPTKNNNGNVGISARYSSAKFTATHFASIFMHKTLEDESSYSDLWTPNIFSSYKSSVHDKGKTFSPQLRGDYKGWIGQRIHVSGSWNYAYARNDGSSESSIVGLNSISNFTSEDSHHINWMLSPSFQFNQKWYLRLTAKGTWTHHNTTYSGSTTAYSGQTRTNEDLSLSLSWLPRSNFMLKLSPGVHHLFRKSDKLSSESTMIPTAGMSFNWTIGNKAMVWGNLSFVEESPSSRSTSNVLVRSSELIWVKGNPGLDNRCFWNGYMAGSWMAWEYLNLAASLDYSRQSNVLSLTYIPAPKELGGIIRSETNADYQTLYVASLNLNSNLMSGRLLLNLTPRWTRRTCRHSHKISQNLLTLAGNIQYTMGNCRVFVEYTPSAKDFDMGGTESFRYASKCSLGIVYGNGNIYFSVKVNNVFNKYAISEKWIDTESYKSYIKDYLRGRSVSVSLTYTFGYGKKTNGDIETADMVKTESSIIK